VVLRAIMGWRRGAGFSALEALLAGVVLFPAMLIGALAWRDYDRTIAGLMGTASQHAALLAEHASKVFESNMLVLDQLNERMSDMGWDAIRLNRAALSVELDPLVAWLEPTRTLVAVDPDGRPALLTLSTPLEPGLSYADREFVTAHRSGGFRYHVSPIVPDRITGRNLFHISRPRTGRIQGADGVLVAELSPDYFRSVWASVDPGPDGLVTLLRDDGVAIVRMPALPAEGPLRLSPATSPLMQAIAAAPEGAFRARSADGLDRISAHMRVGGLPLSIVYEVPLGPALAIWRRTWGAVAGLTALGVGLLIAMTLLAMCRARAEAGARAALAETAERLQAEIARREASEAAAIHIQKMEALGQLTGGVAHDINNMLTAIGGNLRLLLADVPPTGRPKLDSAIQATEIAASVTRQLLAFSRREAAHREVIDVNASIRCLTPLIERTLRADIALEFDLTEERCVAEIDPAQFEATLLNLAANARDAMPSGGKVRFRTRIAAMEADGMASAEATRRTRQPIPTLVVEVIDTGIGMTPEVAAQAFDPFFTTKEVGQGTGLGLSTVYAFARQSGGTAELASRPGHGTTVRLLLPRSFASPMPTCSACVEAVKPAQPAEDRIRGRVLVVEDNALVRLVTEQSLVEMGFQVVGAADGVDALDVLSRDRGFDAVVTDVVMPRGVSGLDLARQAIRLMPNLKVLLVSGYSREQLSDMRPDEPFELLPKPFTPKELGRKVVEMLSGAAEEARSAVKVA